MEPTETIVQQWGAFGAVFVMIIIPLAVDYRRLRIKLDEVQAARVADAREVTAVTKDATKEILESASGQTGETLERIEKMLERVEGRLSQIENELPKRRR